MAVSNMPIKHFTKILNSVRNFGSNPQIDFSDKKIRYDIAVVGGGIIGTAIAKTIKERCETVKVVLIEKECSLGKHQSSHNSGVIHSGIYYKPGSLKAKLCVQGAELLYQYCQDKSISYKTGGKLVVATNYDQTSRLSDLLNKGIANKIKDLKIICSLEEILKIEPNARGVQALWCPRTGNVNFKVVTEHFGKDFIKCGGNVLLNNEVNCIKSSGNIEYPVLLKCNDSLLLETKYLILCGGLQAGTLSNLVDKMEHRLYVSFRVNYQFLKKYVKTNIYATPELNMPFLGVHLSPLADGNGTLLGPTAVPAFKIEGYKKEEINLTYLKKMVSSPAFINMTMRHCSICFDQISKQFCPNIQEQDLQKLAYISDERIHSGPVAVQTQLINEDGSFVDDFVIEFFSGCNETSIGKRTINCKFLPSPGATSSLAIAQYVVDKLLKQLY